MIWNKVIEEKDLREGVASLNPDLRNLVFSKIRENFAGFFSSDDVLDFLKHSGVSKEELLVELLPLARAFSRPEISGFSVGAVLEGVSGALYLGANLEFPFQSLNQTIHAEQAAFVMGLAYEREFTKIAVSAIPCGHCRQFMSELDLGENFTLTTPDQVTYSLEDLLPHRFGPSDLGIAGGFRNPVTNRFTVVDPLGRDDAVIAAAVDAANRSYAPYSKAYAGASFLCRDGYVFTGGYLENAAFNPSISPLQAALIAMNMSGLRPDDILRSVLVSTANTQIHHSLAAGPLIYCLNGKTIEVWDICDGS